jgi:hypothetical protein
MDAEARRAAGQSRNTLTGNCKSAIFRRDWAHKSMNFEVPFI